MEYTHHCSSPLNSVLPVHAISSCLAYHGIRLSLDSGPASTYALEHAVQHHREAITSCTMYTVAARYRTSVHLGLSRRVLQCPNLIEVKLLAATPVNLIIPCVVRNESVKVVDFGVQESDGLAAVAVVMKLWPSLESVAIAFRPFGSSSTLAKEYNTSAFLDSVEVLLKLRHITISISEKGKKLAPLSRLLDKHSYPSRVRLTTYTLGA